MRHQKILFTTWTLSLIASAGSLFFSEVMQYPPCVLCWYQRIAMYPLTILLAIGFLRDDRNSADYALGLVIPGWLIAVYHNLLYYNVLPESSGPCQQGISCTSIFFEWMGFITIPLLSLMAFTLIGFMLFLFKRTGLEK